MCDFVEGNRQQGCSVVRFYRLHGQMSGEMSKGLRIEKLKLWHSVLSV